MSMPKIAKCKACGSADLFWFASNKAAICQFVLGCNHCSETLTVISADRAAEHLNASAEPSAPKHETCKSCHGEGVIHTGIEESPTTLCNRCDGSGNEPKPEACCGSCPAGCVISASEAKCETCDGHGAVGNILNAEPCPDCSYSAPVERDERAEFEREFPGFKAMVIDAKASQKAGHRIEQQSNMFKAWVARAALERQS